jgi:hypothetical protein
MKHSVMTLMLAVLAVSATPCAAQVEILVNGVPQTRYAHGGRWYVEALKGKEYAIRLRNPYPVRAAVALSVDGLNTIDARHTAAADARKWVLGPHETVTISGWQISRAEARRFEFTTEANSYAQALGKAANLGVIAAVFYKERGALITRDERARPTAPPAPSAGPMAPAAESSVGAAAGQARLADEYAATGMGQRTDHAVTTVWLDLENKPAQTMNIRYEFREQLVRLGIQPRRHESTKADPMARRERARGFEAYAPEIPTR